MTLWHRLTTNLHFWAGLMALVSLLHFYECYQQPTRTERYIPDRHTYSIDPLMLPGMALWMVLLCLILPIRELMLPILAVMLGSVLLVTALWFTGLAALAPLLRRVISARGRAALWILPNVLYILFNVHTFLAEDFRPLITVSLPGEWLLPGLAVWSIGAAGVMGWHILSHLRFRKTLLASAIPELNDPMQQLWYQACTVHKVRTDIPLMRSPAVETPLSIGCFQKTMVLVLPEKAYTAEELELIYRHELRHIKRADMRTKIWMVLWKSLLWFFPPVWWAAKITAEDLELCCDEEVLTGAEPETRRRYAELLLDSAAPASGFSTCLSADAAALGRRLKQAISPKKVWRGDWIVGISAGLLMLATANLSIRLY